MGGLSPLMASQCRLKQLQQFSDEAEARQRYLNLLKYIDHLEEQARLNEEGITPKFIEGITELRTLAKRLDPTGRRVRQLNSGGFLPADLWP